jgi:hypothetical protein
MMGIDSPVRLDDDENVKGYAGGAGSDIGDTEASS